MKNLEMILQGLEEISKIANQKNGTFAEIEDGVQKIAYKIGQELMKYAVSELNHMEEENAASYVELGDGSKIPFQRMESRKLKTLYGKVVLKRGYYWSSELKKGVCPFDERLGLNEKKQSPKLQEVVNFFSSEIPFSRVGVLMEKVGLTGICAKTAANISEDAGGEIKSRYEPEADKAWKLMEGPSKSAVDSGREKKDGGGNWSDYPSEKVEEMYIQVDGGRINTDEGWKEPKVGVIFKAEDREVVQKGRGELIKKRYVATLSGLDWFVRMLWLAALQEGVLGAKSLIFMGDGARWIWNKCEELFPDAIQILDFYHAIEHIWNIARLVFGEGKEEGKIWAEKKIEEMKRGEILKIIGEVEGILPFEKEAREGVYKELAYFKSNAGRMRYDKYEKEGYFIGSGAVESGVKRVVNMRFKGCGMRWNKFKADNLLHLRADILSKLYQNAA